MSVRRRRHTRGVPGIKTPTSEIQGGRGGPGFDHKNNKPPESTSHPAEAQLRGVEVFEGGVPIFKGFKKFLSESNAGSRNGVAIALSMELKVRHGLQQLVGLCQNLLVGKKAARVRDVLQSVPFVLASSFRD